MNKPEPISPPRWLLRFFRWFCHPDFAEDIEGDLRERFEKNAQETSIPKARCRLFLEILGLFRPGIIRPVISNYNTHFYAMLFHYLKVLYRNLARNKTFSAINLSGLIIGMVAALILAKYVGFTLMYDQFHERKDRIMLIHHEEKQNNALLYDDDLTYWQVGLTAKERYPEVLKISHFFRNIETHVTATDEAGNLVKFKERNIVTVDSSFTDMFSFHFIDGNPHTALTQPNSVVLTRSTAKKYFPDEKAIGKTLTTSLSWGATSTLQVTGVVEDVPIYSRFQFDFLKSSVGIPPEGEWEYAAYLTYLLLENEANPASLAAKMNQDINGLDEIASQHKQINFSLIPLSKARFTETEVMLGIVGLFILLITWINFVNLTSAKAISRAKETGIRQVVGSGKWEILRQFLFEGMVINFLTLTISVVVVGLAYPFISEFSGHQILPLFNDPTPINGLFLALFIVGAISSSVYPALILSHLHPIRSISGQVFGELKGGRLRSSLVVVQFSISVILLIGVFVISDQMTFMENQDLGINLNQTLIVRTATDQWNGKGARFRSFKDEISRLPIIQQVTSSTTVPSGGNGEDVNFNLTGSEEAVRSHLIGVDIGYMDFYQVKRLAGEDFTRGRFQHNRKSILVNKSMVLAMGFTDPEEAINQEITNPNDGSSYTVIGVVNDYHQNSLKEKIRPLAFHFSPFRGHTSIKIDSTVYASFDRLSGSIHSIEKTWEAIYPNQAFDYYFLDDHFNAQYQSDARFRTLFGIFTGISLFIACMGLFGLSLFMAQKKRKEVGIRKIFGASSIQIVSLFIKKHLFQMLLSVIIGVPIAYFLMNSWLSTYSYRIVINSWELIFPSLLVAALSLLTIGFHSLKMSFLNPVHVLREE